MSALPPHPRYSFIIRIWYELEPNLEGYAPALRGSVQKTGSEQILYFSTLPHLLLTLEKLIEGQDGLAHSTSSPFSL